VVPGPNWVQVRRLDDRLEPAMPRHSSGGFGGHDHVLVVPACHSFWLMCHGRGRHVGRAVSVQSSP